MRLKAIQRPLITLFLGMTSIMFEFVIDFLTATLYVANATFNFLAGFADYLITPVTSRPIFTETIASVFSVTRAVLNFPIWALNIPQAALGRYLQNSYTRGEPRPWYVKNIFARLVRIADKIVNGLAYPIANPAVQRWEYAPTLINIPTLPTRREAAPTRRQAEVPQVNHDEIPPHLRYEEVPHHLLYEEARHAVFPAENIGNQLDNALQDVLSNKSLADLQVYLMGLFGTQWWQINTWSADAKDQLWADIQSSRFVPEHFYEHLTPEQRADLHTNDVLDSRCAISKNLVCIPMNCRNRRFDLLQLLKSMLAQADMNYPHAEYAGTNTIIDEEFIVSTRFDETAFETIQGAIDGMLRPPEQPPQEVEEEETPKPPSPSLTPMHTVKKATAQMAWLGVDVIQQVKTGETPPAPSAEELKAKEQAAAEIEERKRLMREARMKKFGNS